MAKAAGSLASWTVLGGLGAALALQPLGCRGTDEPVDESFIADVLADVGPEVVEPALAELATEAQALEAAAVAWRDAPAEDREAARIVAQFAFASAMLEWQRVEVMQIGPLGSSLTAVAGADGRDEVYSWPTVNACRVDQETVRGGYDEPDFFATTLVNAKGLDALEYVLFAGPDNDCPGQVDINAEGTWDALGPDGVAANRAAFGAALAGEVVRVVQEQQAAWRDGFSAELAAAGSDDSPYDAPIDGLNAIYDALFYVEIATKDRKLAWPLGLRDCTEGCATHAEGVLSGVSDDWIAANLDGFETLFVGGDGYGVDDLLRDRGHGDIVDRLLAEVATAKVAAAALDAPIHSAIQDDPDAVMALHDAVKAITDTLKGDVATVLSMTLPAEAAGDAD